MKREEKFKDIQSKKYIELAKVMRLDIDRKLLQINDNYFALDEETTNKIVNVFGKSDFSIPAFMR